jgi:hypothetical protein
MIVLTSCSDTASPTKVCQQEVGKPFCITTPDSLFKSDVATGQNDMLLREGDRFLIKIFVDENFPNTGPYQTSGKPAEEIYEDWLDDPIFHPVTRISHVANALGKPIVPSQRDPNLNDGRNFLLTLHVSLNARKTPYKLRFTARQGNKVYVQNVERSEGNERHGYEIDHPPYPDGYLERASVALAADITDFGRDYVETVGVQKP